MRPGPGPARAPRARTNPTPERRRGGSICPGARPWGTFPRGPVRAHLSMSAARRGPGADLCGHPCPGGDVHHRAGHTGRHRAGLTGCRKTAGEAPWRRSVPRAVPIRCETRRARPGGASRSAGGEALGMPARPCQRICRLALCRCAGVAPRARRRHDRRGGRNLWPRCCGARWRFAGARQGAGRIHHTARAKRPAPLERVGTGAAPAKPSLAACRHAPEPRDAWLFRPGRRRGHGAPRPARPDSPLRTSRRGGYCPRHPQESLGPARAKVYGAPSGPAGIVPGPHRAMAPAQARRGQHHGSAAEQGHPVTPQHAAGA